jgi:hypothetical protein
MFGFKRVGASLSIFVAFWMAFLGGLKKLTRKAISTCRHVSTSCYNKKLIWQANSLSSRIGYCRKYVLPLSSRVHTVIM